jgi:2-methylcitrate dehydratase PrpD
MDGTVTTRSFDDAHLWNPELRALIQKIEVVENAEFTKAYERLPVEHRTRVTVVAANGERLVGESGGDKDDLSTQKSAAQIGEKFRGLTEDYLGAKRIDSILERLWNLEDVGSVTEIPLAFVLG